MFAGLALLRWRVRRRRRRIFFDIGGGIRGGLETSVGRERKESFSGLAQKKRERNGVLADFCGEEGEGRPNSLPHPILPKNRRWLLAGWLVGWHTQQTPLGEIILEGGGVFSPSSFSHLDNLT